MFSQDSVYFGIRPALYIHRLTTLYFHLVVSYPHFMLFRISVRNELFFRRRAVQLQIRVSSVCLCLCNKEK
jgi:hypothetical protein